MRMRESERVTEKKGDRKSVWVSEKGGRGFNIGTVRHTAPSDKQEPRLMLPHTHAEHIRALCIHSHPQARQAGINKAVQHGRACL